jgi:hypothetical protein
MERTDYRQISKYQRTGRRETGLPHSVSSCSYTSRLCTSRRKPNIATAMPAIKDLLVPVATMYAPGNTLIIKIYVMIYNTLQLYNAALSAASTYQLVCGSLNVCASLSITTAVFAFVATIFTSRSSSPLGI